MIIIKAIGEYPIASSLTSIKKFYGAASVSNSNKNCGNVPFKKGSGLSAFSLN
ncbi:hypothetical protein B4064_3441 [Caldibacillus thermoamylovorans]|uniref:Uncharacterized protein n=1 Tax=Caldibacillus thermoamylovorans TaxID=35841 RepID=A0A0D0ERK1_9BACI|nr:hypothetical protein B4166_3718 [Caldibacillus thermoamylovorans]KIO61494.1 hypothetical protein B4064_3441 [Caldibacillus thermoamylovorans]KIO69390.1 hypothetical protein B4065_1441 [Caldibacillus thermoamylovorans]KIO72708.1 hypothetical protein B4167_2845 [Caldibacillus thermoamylovorans]